MSDAISQTTATQRIYIAGPMRGIPKYNFPLFDEAEKLLRQDGWEVSNPAAMDRKLGFVENREYSEDELKWLVAKVFLPRDIEALVECDAIALLPSWG